MNGEPNRYRTSATEPLSTVATVEKRDRRRLPVGGRAALLAEWVGEHPDQINDEDLAILTVHCGSKGIRVYRELRSAPIEG